MYALWLYYEKVFSRYLTLVHVLSPYKDSSEGGAGVARVPATFCWSI